MSECYTLHSGWLERITKDTKGKERREHLWSVLKRNGFIFFFVDQAEHTVETHTGKLPINNNTVFTRREKEEKKYGQYVFTIFARDQNKESNVKFKTTKKSSMELWRAYISILGKGSIPPDLDLPTDCIQEMDIILARLRRSPREPENLSAHTNLSRDSGIPHDSVSSVTVTTQRTSASGGSGGSGGGSLISSEGRGGKRHKFSNNPQGDDIYPSWFISNCSREKALSIFTTVGTTYGNTLMRESAQATAQGTYVISYCSKIKDGIPVCDHFKILRTRAGFRIDVDTPHEDLTNLTDVMMYFIKLNGADRTQSLTTNDLSLLGLKDPDYSTYLPDKAADSTPRDPTNTPNKEVRERKISEPPPDYDYEAPFPTVQRPKTVTGATIQQQMRQYNREHAHAKEPARSNRHMHPAMTGTHTVAPMRKGGRSELPPHTRASMPDPDQLRQSPRSAVSWQKDFHVHPQVAYSPNKREETPPPPCEAKSGLGYENDKPNFDKGKADPPVPAQGIPVPPPPPPPPPIIDDRDRMLRLRSQSVPNLEHQLKGVQLSSNPTNHLKDRIVTTSIIQRNPPKSVLPKSSVSFDTGSDRTEANVVEPGVDASNPGGVGTLSKKFGKTAAAQNVPASPKTHTNEAPASSVDTTGNPSVQELKKKLKLEQVLGSPGLPKQAKVASPPVVQNKRDIPLPAIPVEHPQESADEIYDFVNES